jgi:hypothetical protein
MLNSILSWMGILGLIIGPFSLGIFLEQKLQPAARELNSGRLRRY